MDSNISLFICLGEGDGIKLPRGPNLLFLSSLLVIVLVLIVVEGVDLVLDKLLLNPN